MNKRKLQRANSIKVKQTAQAEKQITNRAEKVISYATKGEQNFDYLGNFIFFATSTGEAWMLDHRENRALRLADNYKALPYNIKENSKTFAVKWTEKFAITDEQFISIKDGKENVFPNYPTAFLSDLISRMRK